MTKLDPIWRTRHIEANLTHLTHLLKRAEDIRRLRFDDPERASFCCYVIGYLGDSDVLEPLEPTAPSAPSATAVPSRPNKKDSQ